VPGHVVIIAADPEARSRTFAVAASLLRHIPAEAVYLSIHAADTPQPVRADAMRALLDARSAALADHGLDMRTEIRVGDPVTELLRELLAHEPAMLVVGIGAGSAAATQWLPQLLEGPVRRPVLIVRAPAAGRSGDA
jgi:sulfate/thiosulfate transport system ATP-binding protein